MSTAVLARLGDARTLPVRGSGRGAVHLDLDGFVVTVTAAGVPWMPNGVALAAAPADPLRVGWDPLAPPAWDPAVPSLVGGPDALAALRDWLSSRVAVPPVPLGEAVGRLIGRGPGLTPEGDDVLAGAAIGMRALAAAAGVPAPAAARAARALCPHDVRRRTGALSATLLELAAHEGAGPEPLHRLVGVGDRAAALADLRRLGSSTGAALAGGLALAARHLCALIAAPHADHRPDPVVEG